MYFTSILSVQQVQHGRSNEELAMMDARMETNTREGTYADEPTAVLCHPSIPLDLATQFRFFVTWRGMPVDIFHPSTHPELPRVRVGQLQDVVSLSAEEAHRYEVLYMLGPLFDEGPFPPYFPMARLGPCEVEQVTNCGIESFMIY